MINIYTMRSWAKHVQQFYKKLKKENPKAMLKDAMKDPRCKKEWDALKRGGDHHMGGEDSDSDEDEDEDNKKEDVKLGGEDVKLGGEDVKLGGEDEEVKGGRRKKSLKKGGKKSKKSLNKGGKKCKTMKKGGKNSKTMKKSKSRKAL